MKTELYNFIESVFSKTLTSNHLNKTGISTKTLLKPCA